MVKIPRYKIIVFYKDKRLFEDIVEGESVEEVLEEGYRRVEERIVLEGIITVKVYYNRQYIGEVTDVAETDGLFEKLIKDDILIAVKEVKGTMTHKEVENKQVDKNEIRVLLSRVRCFQQRRSLITNFLILLVLDV